MWQILPDFSGNHSMTDLMEDEVFMLSPYTSSTAHGAGTVTPTACMKP
jgi:hypothetical protein